MSNDKKEKSSLELLRDGKEVKCPFCKEGMIQKKNDAVFLCNKCGKGIVGRVNLE